MPEDRKPIETHSPTAYHNGCAIPHKSKCEARESVRIEMVECMGARYAQLADPQAKLLRAIEREEFNRVGSHHRKTLWRKMRKYAIT